LVSSQLCFLRAGGRASRHLGCPRPAGSRSPRSLGLLIEGEGDRGPSTDRSLGPDSPSVPLDDALHGGETDASPLELSACVQPLEYAEELVGVGHIEARTVVADEKYPPTVFLSGIDLDARHRALAG